MNKKFGQIIRRQRCLLSYSLEELSVIVGISKSYLSLIERGTRPAPVDAKLTIMADMLGIDRDELFWKAGRLPPAILAFVERYPERVTIMVREAMKK